MCGHRGKIAKRALVALLVAGQAAAQSPDLAATGKAVFLDLCSGCHGERGQGVNAPEIAAVPRKLVAKAVRGVDQMPEIEVTEAEIDAITAFLATLAAP
ncbi:MAG: cytochrome c [Sphingomonadales bacterium]|nr:cytochrome c [Sphingomonadales bacterium]